MELLVVDDDGPSLFGRDWFTKLKLDWCQLNQVRATDGLQMILNSHKNLFDDELGKVDIQAKIHITPEAMPVFCRARTVPYALREKIKEEISRLQDQGIIEPVRFSDWAAPVVPVVKSDGRIRLCGDYKVTINRASKIDKYPLPRIDDLLTTLAGGKRFSKLDLAHAYLQVPLDLDSKKFTTINTHKGLYQYTRLPFCISSAPAIFQRIMENILRDVPRVCVYLDDILITGKTDDEHLDNLSSVRTPRRFWVSLKRSKCVFLLPSVDLPYDGHTITAEGLKPNEKKV